ncbi:mitogen-activated protein kinase kinase kinase 15 [Phyllostomus hastatus]|uniref:mitogen-activated protein kinase kinase kinase 15 n=1 Tax=Phyllostomus hastatus TaxID=9423 RepID=UPI001E681B3B|nr:mitogen-activated protein kinase kinase kinase 15 [Phyllostomus hastatus]
MPLSSRSSSGEKYTGARGPQGSSVWARDLWRAQFTSMPEEQVTGQLVASPRAQTPATHAEMEAPESPAGWPVESGGEGPPAEALWAAAEPPQRPPSPGEGQESAAEPAGPEEPDLVALSLEGGGGGPRRPLRAVYVRSDGSQDGAAGGFEVGAFQCLARACEAECVDLSTVPFGELDSGDPAVLDVFYRADIAVVDMSDTSKQPSLFYHLGVRESFSMTNNVILYYDNDNDTILSWKDMITHKNSAYIGNYYIISYIVKPCNDYICGQSDFQSLSSEYVQPDLVTVMGSLCVPLLDRFSSLLKDIHMTSCFYYEETLLNDIQRARERYQDKELAKELAWIKLRIENTDVLSSDVIINLLLSYRDAQDYNAMVMLVERLEILPTCDLADQHSIKFHYAFALSRRNSEGDRDKALQVILQILNSCDNPTPAMFCLCGMIYKDMFLDSHCQDYVSRDSAIEWYRKGFKLQSSLYTGVDLAVLLIVAGQQFEMSSELRNIGAQLNNLLGTKGCLEQMSNYWDVGQFFIISLLASNVRKAIHAAERLFKLRPPVWYLESLVQNLFLILHFKKPVIEHSPRREQLTFWLDIIFAATNKDTNGLRFPVLVIEPTKVYQPSYISVNCEAEERTVSLWHVLPMGMQVHKWNFTATSIKGISISRFDERYCFLFVHGNSDDFQIYFSTKEHCSRFCSLVKEMLNAEDNTMDVEGEMVEDTLEYEYDRDATGNRVILGRGAHGIVYAGRDLSNQVRIAIKEIPEKESRNTQSLHEEIALHRHLKHRNVVQYLSSVSENGYIKIFMEQVPGGSLSTLLQSKWGPLKESTIKFYTKQILEGLKYLHDNQVVHRDIKGDNVLVNIYSGVLKICDFGTSKHLVGVNACVDTFAGTLQYMAPEIINQGLRGYGSPADIWSLGCTVIEMATGRPPFFELGDPQVALYKVGMFKIHPDIPEVLSAAARAFLLRCFEPEPRRRATATDLLKNSFISQVNKCKKTQTAPKPSEDFQSIAPALDMGECMDHSSKECDPEPLELEEQPARSIDTVWEPNHDICHLLSIPDNGCGLEDQITTLYPESRESGLFLLNKDDECRAILYRILREEQKQLVARLQECVAQSSEELYLSVDHFKQIIRFLRDFIHSQEVKVMASMISKLEVDLEFDSPSLGQIQLVLFGFHSAVNEILRNHVSNCHLMFVMDSIIQQAVLAALNILFPELQDEPTSKTEEVKKDLVEVNQDSPPADGPRSAAQELQGEATPDSVFAPNAPPQQFYQLDVNFELESLRQESNRLLEELLQKEEERQSLLQQNVEQKTRESSHLQSRLQCDKTPAPPPGFYGQRPDQELVRWLQLQGADADAIDKIVKQGYTLSDIRNKVTKEDLRYLGLCEELLCKLWTAISQYRRQTRGAAATQNEA